jgi:hypothetical protein
MATATVSRGQFTGQFFNYRSPEFNRTIMMELIGKDAAGSTFFMAHVDDNTAVEKVFADWEIKLPAVRSRFSKVESPAPAINPVRETVPRQEYQIRVKKWLTKQENNPIPCREMRGIIKKETTKAYLVELKGFLAPSSHCLHCGHELTHPVSLLYGLGPICGQHFHINPLNSEEELQERYEEMKRQMASFTWSGWIPKVAVVNMTKVTEAQHG